MAKYKCSLCGYEIQILDCHNGITAVPQSLRWDDGHECYFDKDMTVELLVGQVQTLQQELWEVKNGNAIDLSERIKVLEENAFLNIAKKDG